MNYQHITNAFEGTNAVPDSWRLHLALVLNGFVYREIGYNVCKSEIHLSIAESMVFQSLGVVTVIRGYLARMYDHRCDAGNAIDCGTNKLQLRKFSYARFFIGIFWGVILGSV